MNELEERLNKVIAVGDEQEQTQLEKIRNKDFKDYTLEDHTFLHEYIYDMETAIKTGIHISNLIREKNERYKIAIKQAIEAEEQNLEGYESEVYKILTKALKGDNK